MVRVLFVCLGNICRLPMAEAVFMHKVRAAGLEDRVEADSAGTGHWHVGNPPHEGTRAMLARNRIEYGSGACPRRGGRGAHGGESVQCLAADDDSRPRRGRRALP